MIPNFFKSSPSRSRCRRCRSSQPILLPRWAKEMQAVTDLNRYVFTPGKAVTRRTIQPSARTMRCCRRSAVRWCRWVGIPLSASVQWRPVNSCRCIVRRQYPRNTVDVQIQFVVFIWRNRLSISRNPVEGESRVAFAASPRPSQPAATTNLRIAPWFDSFHPTFVCKCQHLIVGKPPTINVFCQFDRFRIVLVPFFVCLDIFATRITCRIAGEHSLLAGGAVEWRNDTVGRERSGRWMPWIPRAVSTRRCHGCPMKCLYFLKKRIKLMSRQHFADAYKHPRLYLPSVSAIFMSLQIVTADENTRILANAWLTFVISRIAVLSVLALSE